jgi:tRNA wybutosine-synthesizing protein 3
VFEARKNKILEELSLPDAEYTDASPKGSVDEGIRDLIRDINALPGLVTTSSCAGRISVFLEGRKKSDTSVPDAQAPEQAQRQFAQSGGKGTGRWLYVSHDPFVLPEINVASSGIRSIPLHDQFGLVPGDGKPPAGKALQLVRFHFEPLVCTKLSLRPLVRACFT